MCMFVCVCVRDTHKEKEEWADCRANEMMGDTNKGRQKPSRHSGRTRGQTGKQKETGRQTDRQAQLEENISESRLAFV